MFDERHVELAAVGVEQVDAGELGAALAQRPQPGEAADPLTVEAELGMALLELGHQQVEHGVVAAGGQQRRRGVDGEAPVHRRRLAPARGRPAAGRSSAPARGGRRR